MKTKLFVLFVIALLVSACSTSPVYPGMFVVDVENLFVYGFTEKTTETATCTSPKDTTSQCTKTTYHADHVLDPVVVRVAVPAYGMVSAEGHASHKVEYGLTLDSQTGDFVAGSQGGSILYEVQDVIANPNNGTEPATVWLYVPLDPTTAGPTKTPMIIPTSAATQVPPTAVPTAVPTQPASCTDANDLTIWTHLGVDPEGFNEWKLAVGNSRVYFTAGPGVNFLVFSWQDVSILIAGSWFQGGYQPTISAGNYVEVHGNNDNSFISIRVKAGSLPYVCALP